MLNRHHDIRVDIGLRAAGIVLCGLSYLAARGIVMLDLTQAHSKPGVDMFALAAAAFLSVSAGTALLALGHHIFDEVAISHRWQTAYRPALATPSKFEAVTQATEAAPHPLFNLENQRAPTFVAAPEGAA